jgi:hypothetical protein
MLLSERVEQAGKLLDVGKDVVHAELEQSLEIGGILAAPDGEIAADDHRATDSTGSPDGGQIAEVFVHVPVEAADDHGDRLSVRVCGIGELRDRRARTEVDDPVAPRSQVIRYELVGNGVRVAGRDPEDDGGLSTVILDIRTR